MANNRVKAIPRATFAGSSLSTSYQVIDATGLDAPCFLLRIDNDSSQDIDISFDGSTDHLWIESGDTFQLDSQTNSGPPTWLAMWAQGQKIYIKAAAAGTGTIYVSAFYF